MQQSMPVRAISKHREEIDVCRTNLGGVHRKAVSVAVLTMAVPALAGEGEGHGAEIPVEQYLRKEFFSAYFARGTGAVWDLCLPLYLMIALLLAYLIKRKGWTR